MGCPPICFFSMSKISVFSYFFVKKFDLINAVYIAKDLLKDMEVIAINESFRYIDVVDDLIPIETLKASKYDFGIPTVVPSTWTPYKELSQEEYNKEFNRKHSIIGSIIRDTTNIVIAGGAAARPLYTSNKNVYTDLDIFIYGILDERLFWEKVNDVAQKIVTRSSQNNRDCCITQKMKKGIVVIGVASPDHQLILEYQIILRMYHTMSSIIHAFDIPSCCVVYDGITAFTTTLGAYAHTNQVNLVTTTYRSTSFEKRLVKYFERGFGLGLIGYDADKAYNIRDRSMSHKYLHIDVNIREGNNIVGNIRTVSYYGKYMDSEYSAIRPRIFTYKEFVTQIQCIEDIGLILRRNSHKLVDYTLFYDSDVAKIIELYPSGTEHLIEKQCDQIQRTELRNINHMKFSKKIIKEMIDIILTNSEHDATKKITDVLTEQIHVNARYVPEWLIVQDPQRQYTAAINPIIEDPEDWYGPGLYKK